MNFIHWLKGIFGVDNHQEEPKRLVGAVDERLAKTKEELITDLDEALGTIEKLKRAYAEELNGKTAFQKRIRKERDRAIDEGRAKVMSELLDLSDELDRALEALKSDQGSNDQFTNPLMQGVEMVRDSMKRRLELQGVTRMELVGKPFDPNTAEALEIVQVNQADQNNVVIQQLRPGFELKGMVIREARVTVGKWVVPSKSPQNPETPQEADLFLPTAGASEQTSSSSDDGGLSGSSEAKPQEYSAPAESKDRETFATDEVVSVSSSES